MVRICTVLASLSVVLVAGCGGGGGDDASSDVAAPLALPTVHEWVYADVGLPEGWSVTGDVPGGFTVATEPDLVPVRGLSDGQVSLLVGYSLNDPSLDVPLAEDLTPLLETRGLEFAESVDTTMLGHPAEIVTATGERYDYYEARVSTAPRTAFVLRGYAAPGELGRYRPTFDEMVATAVLKGLLAGE